MSDNVLLPVSGVDATVAVGPDYFRAFGLVLGGSHRVRQRGVTDGQARRSIRESAAQDDTCDTSTVCSRGAPEVYVDNRPRPIFRRERERKLSG